jgi:hypothetical protein
MFYALSWPIFGHEVVYKPSDNMADECREAKVSVNAGGGHVHSIFEIIIVALVG